VPQVEFLATGFLHHWITNSNKGSSTLRVDLIDGLIICSARNQGRYISINPHLTSRSRNKSNKMASAQLCRQCLHNLKVVNYSANLNIGNNVTLTPTTRIHPMIYYGSPSDFICPCRMSEFWRIIRIQLFYIKYWSMLRQMLSLFSKNRWWNSEKAHDSV